MLDAVTRLLFEDVMLLLVAEFIALTVVLAIHRRRMTPQSRRMIWVTLAVCGLLLLIQHLTETKREALERMLGEMAVAVDEGEIGELADRLDDSFTWQGKGKSAFVEEVRGKLRRWQIDNASIGGFEIEMAGDQATVKCRAKCDGRDGDRVRYGLPSFWTFECVLRDDGWKLNRIAEAEVMIYPGNRIKLHDIWR